MFEMRRAGDFSIRYYGESFGILGHRSGRRIGVQGPLLRVVREIEGAIGLEKLINLASAGDCASELLPVKRVLAVLLARFWEQPPGTYSKLLKAMPDFNEYALGHRHPLFAMVELTYRCNLRCRHCYILHQVAQPQPENMGEDQAVLLLRALADLGCLDVTLTGGEVTLSSGWWRIVREAKDLGLFTMLKTNGLTFTAKNVERYAEDPAHSTHLSLYGSTAETHEAITGQPGSFAKTLAAMRQLTRAGIPCKVFCLIWKGNLDQADSMRSLVEDLGHGPVLSSTIYGRLDGDRTPLELRISPAENDDLVGRGLVPPFQVAPCTAGRTKVKIEPSGRLATCELLSPTFGPAGPRTLAEVWNHPELRTYGDEMIALSQSGQGGGLSVFSCPGINMLNTGSVSGVTTFAT